MSFNSAIYDYERNETMLSGPHFKRKTMVTTYESDVVAVPPEEVEQLDPDLLFYYDLSDTNYTEEKVSKDPMFQMSETGSATMRPQVIDIYGVKGVKSSYRDYGSTNVKIEVNNNSQSFPVGTFDNINPDNLTFRYEYSIEGGFDLKENVSFEPTGLFIEPEFFYKFGTSSSSSDPDDPLQPSGLSNAMNGKDRRAFLRAMNTDPTTTPFNINSFRPGGREYQSLFEQHRDVINGTFGYCVNGNKHQLAFGYRTKADGLYFFMYHNKKYYDEKMSSSLDVKTHINRHLPLLTFRERYDDFNMVLHSIKIYNRFLEASEFDDFERRFPFLYHYVSTDYVIDNTKVSRVIDFNHVQYLEFLTDYASNPGPLPTPFDFTKAIWYEYEIEIQSSTSTFAIEFFNVLNTQGNATYLQYTNNYFDSSWDGLAFGVDGNQFLKYKCGNTIQTTTTSVPLNQKKFISFLYTSTEVKFYYDKTLVATVLRSSDASLFTHCEGLTQATRLSVFNLGASNNRAHFLVRHNNTDGISDLPTADNSVF